MILWEIEARWLEALLEAAMPAGASSGLPKGATSGPVIPVARDLLANAPPLIRISLRLAIWFIYLIGPLWTSFVPRTFGSLQAAQQVRVLAQLNTSSLYPVRELPLLLKLVGALAYGALPEVHRKLNSSQITQLPSWARNP